MTEKVMENQDVIENSITMENDAMMENIKEAIIERLQ